MMQRSPPKQHSSNPDLSTTNETLSNVSIRKRKQPDNEILEEIKNMQTSFTQALRDLRRDLDAKFENIADSIQTVRSDLENYQSQIKKDIDDLRCENNTMKIKVENLTKEVSDLQESTQFISNQQDEFGKYVGKISEYTKSVDEHEQTIITLTSKIDNLEQQARQCNIEISNLPEKRDENLLSLIESIGTQIGCVINRRDVVSIHRVPHASQNNKPKNVIAKLTSRILRDNVLGSYRIKKGLLSTDLGFSGAPHNIYLNEHLTLRNKKLFRSAREAANQNNFKFVWVKHSTILVRASENSPVIAIRTEQDIKKIQNAGTTTTTYKPRNSLSSN
ncbi:uncharacterized protein LOC126370737 [Pectinophora gossypiella]|uniref:uncharacterized protein LOC126370737 n=1 Tax=Pectinophora gossypiella TaxID=13191 RepID=UPI00214EAF6B|nr:uncharacterized protein LOC126370737 [Pectinophora gossypiella]